MAGLIRFDTGCPRVTWLIAALVLLGAGWMGFDGARALLVGDYITPGGSGRLGPWSGVVGAVGIDPRSTLMKAIFVFYGLASLGVLMAFLQKASWAWWGMTIAAALGLWYLPFGTLINLLVLVLLLLPSVRAFWFGGQVG